MISHVCSAHALRYPGSRYFELETCPETMAWVWGWFYAPNRGGWSLLGQNAKIHEFALLAEAVVGLRDGDLLGDCYLG